MKVDIIGLFDRVYSKLPSLPQDLKELTVRLLPLLSLVAGILILLASVLNFLGFAFVSSFTLSSSGLKIVEELFLRSAMGVAQGVIMIFAFNPLRLRQLRGWRLVFWSQFLWILSGLLGLSLWFVLGLLLLYPIFQVRSYYNK